MRSLDLTSGAGKQAFETARQYAEALTTIQRQLIVDGHDPVLAKQAALFACQQIGAGFWGEVQDAK